MAQNRRHGRPSHPSRSLSTCVLRCLGAAMMPVTVTVTVCLFASTCQSLLRRAFRSPMSLAFTAFVAFFHFAIASNWAQSSGSIKQNIVIPYIPAPNARHWQARYGHAVVVVPDAESGDKTGANTLGTVFLLGGDTYDGSTGPSNVAPGLLDQSWYNGLKNDVWSSKGTQWSVRGDTRLRNGRFLGKQRLPVVRSELEWTLKGKGSQPPRGMTYDKWISCEDFFKTAASSAGNNADCSTPRSVMWSPRREHAAVFFKGLMYVLGGRAREYVTLAHTSAIGGIVGPRIEDVQAGNQPFTTQREAVVVKNDVWRSADGITWSLATPGCKRPQADQIAGGNAEQGKQGRAEDACQKDSDCYGAETCGYRDIKNTCVCPMWSPREQHAAATFGGFMYVMGGYASRLYNQLTNCGPFACGSIGASTYRYYAADLWRSSDGERWTELSEYVFPVNLQSLGRGGHQLVVIPDINDNPQLWILGGRGGDNTGLQASNFTFFNDIWNANLDPGSGNVAQFSNVQIPVPWSPRASFTATLEEKTSRNGYTRTLYVIGGVTSDNNTESPFLDEVWSWRPNMGNADIWRKDFSEQALFGTGGGTQFKYANNSPAIYYISPDSDLSLLQRYRVPTKIDEINGKPLETRPYLTQSKLDMLHSVGLTTIRQLANADLYTILKLRGFDFPAVPLNQRLHFGDVCNARALAIAVVGKCSVSTSISLYDGERNMPWNIVPVFGGSAPQGKIVTWHGMRNYNSLKSGDDDPIKQTAAWDGCANNPLIEGLSGPNVPGLGIVSQLPPDGVVDPTPDLQNLFCKWTPGPRAFHAATLFEERIYIFGGKNSEQSFGADTWYRDARLPTARFLTTPPTRSPYPIFQFTADEPGVVFEYRVWDPYNYREVRSWTVCVSKTDIGWLSWRLKGPSDGTYTMYVRAVDPAGNRDVRYVLNRNVYTWYYVSPTPWDIIAEVVGSFIGLCIIGYLEYRRRVKKAAMERYAMKRMRRKFKAMQRDIDGRALDWRSLYLESKEQDDIDTKRRKGNKKMRDKKKEKREKERKKREKEKERIKKKLKAGKDAKAKGKKDGGAIEDKEKDKGKDKKKKKKKGELEDGDVDGDGAIEDGEFHGEMQGLLKSSVDAKSEKAKAKARLKDDKKYKEYEDELAKTQKLEADLAAASGKTVGGGGGTGAGSTGGESGGAGTGTGTGTGSGTGKRFKDYEAGGVASGSAPTQGSAPSAAYSTTSPAPVAGDGNNDLEKEGAKQRRTNKRYKDYEAGDDGNNKKDK